MRIVPTLAWMLATDPAEPLDARLVPLLQAIAASGSLAAAVTRCDLSYRAAWGVLKEEQRRLGAALVVLERGRGARLAPAGAKLVSGQRTAEQHLARSFSTLALELGQSAPEPSHSMESLTIAASHDPALAALRDTLPAAVGLAL
jgi:putative molybdopterin biosynthesis protein